MSSLIRSGLGVFIDGIMYRLELDDANLSGLGAPFREDLVNSVVQETLVSKN